MKPAVQVSWDEGLTAYDFGPGHPMTPIRTLLTAQLSQALGLFDAENVRLCPTEPAPDDLLLTVHTAEYIAAVKACSLPGAAPNPAFGLGEEDNPIFENMHTAAAKLVAGTVAGCEAVMQGSALRAVNFCGGMHHAMPGKASGFCIYNDIAVGIQRMLDLGAKKIVYVDIDAHHGDGVEHIFWNDPRVVTVSIHESGRTLFPGTGFAHETGGASAEGSAINVALPAGTPDAGWLRAISAIVPAVVADVRPDVLFTQHGCDTHVNDPLANLRVSVDAQREAMLMMRQLADRECGGRWVAVGGGGYDALAVVPRTFSHLVAVASGQDVPVTRGLPSGWIDRVREEYGAEAPRSMGDGATVWFKPWESGYDPSDEIDRAIMATRREAFPHLGLDPWFD
ncbi:acetoin utilization protein AcuC [Micrococcales bacterium 31B]|nr:acetoin utilization protein AcuC [Micrococcales bacterium 31B]